VRLQSGAATQAHRADRLMAKVPAFATITATISELVRERGLPSSSLLEPFPI
jgi:hypothetical protein